LFFRNKWIRTRSHFRSFIGSWCKPRVYPCKRLHQRKHNSILPCYLILSCLSPATKTKRYSVLSLKVFLYKKLVLVKKKILPSRWLKRSHKSRYQKSISRLVFAIKRLFSLDPTCIPNAPKKLLCDNSKHASCSRWDEWSKLAKVVICI